LSQFRHLPPGKQPNADQPAQTPPQITETPAKETIKSQNFQQQQQNETNASSQTFCVMGCVLPQPAEVLLSVPAQKSTHHMMHMMKPTKLGVICFGEFPSFFLIVTRQPGTKRHHPDRWELIW